MAVDVTWEGVPLARGATAREQDGGWFVELEQPMPVGTRITLSGDVQAELAVVRVHEGVGAGMVLRAAVSRQPSAVSPEKASVPPGPATVPAPVATPAAPVHAVPAVRAIPELATPGRKPLVRKSS